MRWTQYGLVLYRKSVESNNAFIVTESGSHGDFWRKSVETASPVLLSAVFLVWLAKGLVSKLVATWNLHASSYAHILVTSLRPHAAAKDSGKRSLWLGQQLPSQYHRHQRSGEAGRPLTVWARIASVLPACDLLLPALLTELLHAHCLPALWGWSRPGRPLCCFSGLLPLGADLTGLCGWGKGGTYLLVVSFILERGFYLGASVVTQFSQYRNAEPPARLAQAPPGKVQVPGPPSSPETPAQHTTSSASEVLLHGASPHFWVLLTPASAFVLSTLRVTAPSCSDCLHDDFQLCSHHSSHDLLSLFQ